jgi:hypothetical protein
VRDDRGLALDVFARLALVDAQEISARRRLDAHVRVDRAGGYRRVRAIRRRAERLVAVEDRADVGGGERAERGHLSLLRAL